jgi:hypothetical protein
MIRAADFRNIRETTSFSTLFGTVRLYAAESGATSTV